MFTPQIRRVRISFNTQNMKDMRIYNYDIYIDIKKIRNIYIKSQKDAALVTDHFAYLMKFIRVLFEG